VLWLPNSSCYWDHPHSARALWEQCCVLRESKTRGAHMCDAVLERLQGVGQNVPFFQSPHYEPW